MRCRGFTLVELMITVAVLAVLAAIAFPSFESTLQSNRAATGSNTLMAAIALARTEAIRNPGRAVICPSTDQLNCDGDDWNEGWLIWIDTDSNGLLESDDVVLRFVDSRSKLEITMDSSVTGPDREQIVFDTRGRNLGPARSFHIQPTGCAADQPRARTLTLSPVGQVVIKKVDCS